MPAIDFTHQKFGVEIEMTGLTRATAAKVLIKHFGNDACHEGGPYDKYTVRDMQNRKWSIVSDSSLTATHSDGSSAGAVYKTEFVTPICTYEDMSDIQELVRGFRKAGGICNSSTGIHIHINAEPFTPRTLRNLVNIVASKEDMIYDALQVNSGRQTYCKKVDRNFLERLNNNKPRTMEQFKDIWYNGHDGSYQHYHNSRYRLLNLHSVFSKGTVEFRAFNSTLHAGVIRSYVAFCLAISHQAQTQKSASFHKTYSENQKYTFRTWLLRLGMIGEEYKNCRMHLLSHLDGNIAWKNPEQAVLQRERLKAKREMEREQTVEPVCDFREQEVNVPDENMEGDVEEFESVAEDEDMSMSM